MDNMLFTTIVLTLLFTALGFWILYAIIKAAVLAALRQHTVSSTTGVSIVNSVPLKIADTSDEGAVA